MNGTLDPNRNERLRRLPTCSLDAATCRTAAAAAAAWQDCTARRCSGEAGVAVAYGLGRPLQATQPSDDSLCKRLLSCSCSRTLHVKPEWCGNDEGKHGPLSASSQMYCARQH